MNSMRTASAAAALPSPSNPFHGLGEDITRPRNLYVTHIPAALFLTGIVAWISGNEIGMVAAAAVAGAVSLYLFWDWLFREGPTRFSTLVAMALLQGYGLGTLNTWLTLPRGGFTIAQFLGGDEGSYARGMAAVLMASVPLIFLGELFERPLFGSEFRLPLDQSTYLFIFAGTLAMIGGFLTHSIGFQGVQTVAGEQLGVIATLLGYMFPSLTALTVAVFLVSRGRLVRLAVGLCSVILCILIMVVSRRIMIYTAMVLIFSLRLTGYRLKGTFFKKMFLIAGSGIVLAIGVTVFMLLRLAGIQARAMDAPLTERIQIALSWVEEGTALSRATEANRVNAQKRTFVLGFFADILEGSSLHTPAFGQDVLGYTLQSVPRVLNPEKDLGFSEERLVDAQFGLTYSDGANSVLTNGATDFGLIGVLAYPLLVVALFRFILNILSRILPVMPVAFIAIGMIFSLVQTENSFEAYLTTIRDVIIFSFILIVFARLPRFSLQNR